MARLEGAYEQINHGLHDLRGEVHALRGELMQRIDRVDQKVDVTFRWVIGVVFLNWVTIMLALFLRPH